MVAGQQARVKGFALDMSMGGPDMADDEFRGAHIAPMGKAYERSPRSQPSRASQPGPRHILPARGGLHGVYSFHSAACLRLPEFLCCMMPRRLDHIYCLALREEY